MLASVSTTDIREVFAALKYLVTVALSHKNNLHKFMTESMFEKLRLNKSLSHFIV